MREKTHSIKRSFLSIVLVVGTLGIEELSTWTSFVHQHYMLGALWRIRGIFSFYVRLSLCSLTSHVDFCSRRSL
jgi:hypothetical protein